MSLPWNITDTSQAHLEQFIADQTQEGPHLDFKRDIPTKTGKWRAKVKAYMPLLEANDPKYAPDRSNDSLVRLLFPEMAPLPWD